jgi:SAM-dependent methyltransferase
VCPFCGFDNAQRTPLSISISPWNLKRCRDCGFVYLENAPGYDDLAGSSCWQKNYLKEKERRRNRYPVLQRIGEATRFRLGLFPDWTVSGLLRRFVPSGTVLDVGCGDGSGLDELPAGFRPCGIELCADLASYADRRVRAKGGFVVAGPALHALDRFAGEGVAAVVMHGFLEHELRPHEVLLKARATMRPGGGLILMVPNFGSINARVMRRAWCGLFLPGHMNYFTPSHLAGMVQSAGFDIRRFSLLYRLPTSDLMWMVAKLPG